MMENAEVFHELTVRDYESSKDWDGPNHAYRFRSNWESKPGTLEAKLDELAKQPGAAQLKAIIIGMWGSDSQDTSQDIVQKLAKIAKYLLDCLDITFVPVNEQLVAAGADIYIEQGFEIFDVLVLDAKQRIQTLGWQLEFFYVTQNIDLKQTLLLIEKGY